MLDVVFEDKFLIVVNKPAKLLTIANEKERDKTLYHMVSDYLKRKNKNNRIFIIHRLDYDTSGLVVFAKNEKIKNLMQDNWTNVKRKYIALLSGKLSKKEDTIKSYLKETKTLRTYSTDRKDGKFAITTYKVIKWQDNNTLVEIDLVTGRKNQIRVHMSDIGHPIIGDVKYGNVKSKYMLLHAYYLEFLHPITSEKMMLTSDLPKYFSLINYSKI